MQWLKRREKKDNKRIQNVWIKKWIKNCTCVHESQVPYSDVWRRYKYENIREHPNGVPLGSEERTSFHSGPHMIVSPLGWINSSLVCGARETVAAWGPLGGKEMAGRSSHIPSTNQPTDCTLLPHFFFSSFYGTQASPN